MTTFLLKENFMREVSTAWGTSRVFFSYEKKKIIKMGKKGQKAEKKGIKEEKKCLLLLNIL